MNTRNDTARDTHNNIHIVGHLVDCAIVWKQRIRCFLRSESWYGSVSISSGIAACEGQNAVHDNKSCVRRRRLAQIGQNFLADFIWPIVENLLQEEN
jgi:hypothetical protein